MLCVVPATGTNLVLEVDWLAELGPASGDISHYDRRPIFWHWRRGEPAFEAALVAGLR